MPEDSKVEYIPFHAINEFMRDDFRSAVLHEVFTSFEQLNKDQTSRISRLFARGVQIPGFRNSSQAPLGVKIRHSNAVFEKSAEFAGLIVDCWSQLHKPLGEAVWQLLDERNWKPLPIAADRTQLPGFQVDWPKEDNFEALIEALKNKNPDIVESDDNISLMVVWIGNRLPYGVYEETTP